MARLYVNQTLEKQIRQYCELNEIEDINAFANRCLSQGFNIVKYGTSPSDNSEMENKGIKDIIKNEQKRKTDADRSIEEKPTLQKTSDSGNTKEEIKPIEEEKKPAVTVRKIQIIKRDKK